MRIRRLQRPRLPPLPRARHRPRARADRRPRPERGRQVHDPAGHRAGPHPAGHERRRRPRGAPAVGRRRRGALGRRHRVRAGRGGRPQDRARSRRRSPASKGTVRLDYDGQAITDPTLADQVLAELTGIPTEAFFRSTASVRHHELSDLVARRGARCATGSRRRISGADRGHQPGQEEARPGAPRPDDQGRQEPGPAQGRRGRPSPRPRPAVEQGELALAQLERDRDALSGARERRAEAEAALAERREHAREGAPGRAPHRRAGRGPASATSATAQAVEVDDRDRRAGRQPTRRPTRCPSLRAGGRAAAGPRHAGSASCRRPWPARSRSTFEVAPSRPGGRCRAGRSSLVVLGAARRRRRRSPRRRSASSTSGTTPQLIGGGRRRHRPGPRRASRSGCAAATRCRASCATSRSTAACAAAPRWRPSSRQAEADTEQQLGTLGLADLADGRGPARPRGGPRRPDRPARRPSSTASSARSRARRCRPMRDAAALEIEQKTSALEALGPIAKEPRARERLEVEVRDQETRARARPRRRGQRPGPGRGQHRRRRAGRRRRPSGSPTWREQLAALAAPPARLRRRPWRAIERAEQATMKTATRYLEAHMVRDLAPATGGRYRRVRVDDKTLDIEVRAPERGDWVQVTRAQPGHARPRLPDRAARARPARDRRPPAAAGLRRSVRHARRRPRGARARRCSSAIADRLPGHLPDDLGPLRRARPTPSSSCPGRPRSTTVDDRRARRGAEPA